MIKQTIQRIEKLIKDRNYLFPEILGKLYSLLMHFAKRIEQKNSEFAALDIYADALKMFRKYLGEEPFKLTKITTLELNQALSSSSFQHFSQIFDLRDRLLKELSAFTPSDSFGRRVLSEMVDLKWAKKMKISLEEGQTFRSHLEKKKGTTYNVSEITTMLWFKELKGDSLVHINKFLETFLTFVKEYFPVLDFIDDPSLICLRELCDPDRKYFITASDCDEIFIKLRNPDVLEKLWLKSQENKKNDVFVSQSSLILRLTNADNSIDQIIGITGQKIIQGEGQQKNVKEPPVVVIGSSLDSDIVLKNKYISRKQMAIIQDKKSEKSKGSQLQKSDFSLICLSQSNFTVISYPYKTKAHIGSIFFGKDIKYQIVTCQKIDQHQQIQAEMDEDNKTLSILPSDKNKNRQSLNSVLQLTVLVLSGEDKGSEVIFSTKDLKQDGKEGNQHLSTFQQVFEEDLNLYLKPFTKILCKTANEIVEGRLSRKIRLSKNMKIFLDDFTLSVQ